MDVHTLAQTPLICLIGYLMGSLPFAVIVSRAFGLPDPRRVGSGNPGATNVLRSGNKLAAVLTLLGDALKGWLAMLLAHALGADETWVAAVGLAAFLGHIFPVFLGFKGGKGVATALGVLAGLNSLVALICVAIWLSTAVISRYSSLSALFAACAAPLAAWVLGLPTVSLAVIGVMSSVLILRHSANIRNLIAGTEGKIGKGKRD